jgi:DNA-3-methyladenine glycosylase
MATAPRTLLTRDFFDRPAESVAPELLGRTLVVDRPDGTVTLRLTEVEAYSGSADPASHAYRGPTPRNQVMFGPPGHLYVYFTYGMHYCANVVTGPGSTASAVLLRAGEVLDGRPLAGKRRRASRRDSDLARGPARLAVALDIDRALQGVDVCDPGGPVRILDGTPAGPEMISSGPRTGISQAMDVPWRFWITGDPTVSPYRRHRPRRLAEPGRTSAGT